MCSLAVGGSNLCRAWLMRARRLATPAPCMQDYRQCEPPYFIHVGKNGSLLAAQVRPRVVRLRSVLSDLILLSSKGAFSCSCCVRQ